MRFRLLDLFCGGGGCSMGYHRAGFDVVGVDSEPQKHYPFEFHQADAIEFCERYGDQFDVIHASPPCQMFTSLSYLPANRIKPKVNLIPQARAALTRSGKIYIIENVPQAPLLFPVMVCGSYFKLGVRRHRLFESNTVLFGTECFHKQQGQPIGVYGNGGAMKYNGKVKKGRFGKQASRPEARAAMEIDWMNHKSICQAIPPAYTEYLGLQLIQQLTQKHKEKPMPEEEKYCDGIAVIFQTRGGPSLKCSKCYAVGMQYNPYWKQEEFDGHHRYVPDIFEPEKEEQ